MASSMKEVIQLVDSTPVEHLAPRLDELELQAWKKPDLDQWPCAAQLLGHIYTGNLQDARFVWKRATNEQKQDVQFKAAFKLLQHLWNKDYQGCWSILSSKQWSANLLKLVQAIAAKQRQHTVRLVSCAYSSIHPERLASLTGTNSQEALQIAQSEGWQLNNGTILVKGKKLIDDNSKPATDHLQHLTEFVIQLEA